MAPISKFSCSDLTTLHSYFTAAHTTDGYMAGPQKDHGREDLMIFTSNWLSTTNMLKTMRKLKVDDLNILLLRLWDNCAHVAKTNNEERYGLEEEVDVKMVPPIRKIIPSTGEEEGCHTELRNVQPELLLKISCMD